MTAIFKSLAQHATPVALQVIKQCHVIKALFNCLANFRSNDAQVSQVLNYQGGDTFNLPLAANIILAANFFLTKEGSGNNHQMKPMTSEFGRHEMQAMQEMFTTIFTEMRGQRDLARWQGNAREEGTAGHLYQVSVQFLQNINLQFQPLAREQKYAQQASEVINISQSLTQKFQLLIQGNVQEIMNLMQMEGNGLGGGVGGMSGAGMVDPDDRLAMRLKQNIANNPAYVEGTGTPITVYGAIRDLGNNTTTEFTQIGRIGQNLPFRMLKFWLINNPNANLGFAPDQLMYQIQDPRSREYETRVMDKETDFKRCMREIVSVWIWNVFFFRFSRPSHFWTNVIFVVEPWYNLSFSTLRTLRTLRTHALRHCRSNVHQINPCCDLSLSNQRVVVVRTAI